MLDEFLGPVFEEIKGSIGHHPASLKVKYKDGKPVATMSRIHAIKGINISGEIFSLDWPPEKPCRADIPYPDNQDFFSLIY